MFGAYLGELLYTDVHVPLILMKLSCLNSSDNCSKFLGNLKVDYYFSTPMQCTVTFMAVKMTFFQIFFFIFFLFLLKVYQGVSKSSCTNAISF